MRKWTTAWLAAALVMNAVADTAAAQRPLRDIGDDIRYVAEDILWVWSSPVRGDQRGWLVAAATGLGFAALLPFDERIDNWVVQDTTRGLFRALRPVRKGGSLYGGSFLAPLAGAAYIAGIAFDKPDVRDAISGCGASWLANSFGRKLTVYRLAGRARPSANRGNDVWLGPNYKKKVHEDSAWHYRSFPGGHVANVAACASFFGNRFEWGPVEPALYAFAIAVGLGRFPDRAHWASDQLVGAVMGYAIGKAVADRQLSRRAKRLARESGVNASDNSSLFADPAEGLIKIGWQLRF
jgi:membrane-associated phospholipid phosphatase